MNPWDIDPSLYAALWRMLREWYLRRSAAKNPPTPLPPSGCEAGCRS